MLTLHGRHLTPLGRTSTEPFIARVCETAALPVEQRGTEVLLLREPLTAPLPGGFRAHFVYGTDGRTVPEDTFILALPLRHVAEGDVVRVDPVRRTVEVLYRRTSPSNTFLVTERCDNYCVMCSQPPRERDDSWIVDELKQVIPLVSTETAELGLSGGEPALLGEGLVELISLMKRHLPATAVHILSNGRRFADGALARSLARVEHPDLMIGIPLYADLSHVHDHVVQARGAFSETVRGILELKRRGVRVELRFVIHAGTVRRMRELAEFIVRNLLFVDHVALMGLEIMGFAKTNLDALWVDPIDYQDQLTDAVQTLADAGMDVSLYNHQLCVLNPALHPYARRSISDWKNEYFDTCDGCAVRSECGGFFSSSRLRASRGIHPVAVDHVAAQTARLAQGESCPRGA